MNVYDKANELVEAIKESEQYKKYEAAALEVDKNETHSKMVLDFIKLQYEMNVHQMNKEDIPSELMDRFNLLYSNITNVSAVMDFLQAQVYFGTMIEDISKSISEATNTGAKFLDPEKLKETL